MDVGQKIRALRLGNNLTQEELASRLELTKGYISQLENNKTSPSMATLFNILEVLGTDVHQFFSKENDQVVTFKEEDFYEKEDDALQHVISWIVPNAVKYEMEPIMIKIMPGGTSIKDDPHPGEEFGYILEGSVTLVLNTNKYTLKKGETFYYLANQPHYLMNHTNAPCKVLWISTPPTF
jgi:transcriptional regulator with XRE-family HTH domain